MSNTENTDKHVDSPRIDKSTNNEVLPKVFRYVVLMETSGEECESWYYCIRYEGNENNLKHLQEQLESVDWYILEDLSTFDLDLDHFISENTAKELTKLELNHVSFHRKFDGVLDEINLNIREKDSNEKRMTKVFDILSYGQIEDYIDEEDIDEEDLTESHSSEEDSDSEHNYSKSDSDSKSDIQENATIPKSLRTSNQHRSVSDKKTK